MTQGSTKNALDRLPHRAPFRFLSRVDVLERGHARGTWVVSGDEDFFRGHFPGDPVLPGVLIAEAVAQLSGLIGAEDRPSGGRLAHVDIKFITLVRPPAEITLSSRLVRSLGGVGLYDVSAAVGALIVARGTLSVAGTVER